MTTPAIIPVLDPPFDIFPCFEIGGEDVVCPVCAPVVDAAVLPLLVADVLPVDFVVLLDEVLEEATLLVEALVVVVLKEEDVLLVLVEELVEVNFPVALPPLALEAVEDEPVAVVVLLVELVAEVVVPITSVVAVSINVIFVSLLTGSACSSRCSSGSGGP